MKLILLMARFWLSIALALLWPAFETAAASDTGYSALAEITADNVKQLNLVFSFKLSSGSGYASTPQMAGNTLFVLTPFPHTLYALEAFGDAAGSGKWRYSPESNPHAPSLRSSVPGALGLAVAENAIYFNTLDGHTIALDGASGRGRWDRQTADIAAGETLGAAPLVVGNAIVIGNAGDDFGARGWIEALDRDSGQELWRKYSTGPDGEVGIDSSF